MDRKLMKAVWSVLLVFSASATPVTFAQSLADVARQEAARRATIRIPSKVLTNSTLTPDPRQGPSAPIETALPPVIAVPPANPSASQVVVSAPVTPAADVLDEQQWRSRAAMFRGRVAAATGELTALARISHADPKEQALLESLRQKRQAALTQAEDALRRFEAQAAAAKVPQAWIMNQPM